MSLSLTKETVKKQVFPPSSLPGQNNQSLNSNGGSSEGVPQSDSVTRDLKDNGNGKLSEGAVPSQTVKQPSKSGKKKKSRLAANFSKPIDK